MISSKTKPKTVERDQGKELNNKIFQDFLNKNNIKIYSRNTSLGAVFTERFNRTIRDLPKKFVFEKCVANWFNVLPTMTKQYNNRVHTPTKLSLKDASLKKNEAFANKNLLVKRKKLKIGRINCI